MVPIETQNNEISSPQLKNNNLFQGVSQKEALGIVDFNCMNRDKPQAIISIYGDTSKKQFDNLQPITSR
jgi:hypothetical protein